MIILQTMWFLKVVSNDFNFLENDKAFSTKDFVIFKIYEQHNW